MHLACCLCLSLFVPEPSCSALVQQIRVLAVRIGSCWLDTSHWLELYTRKAFRRFGCGGALTMVSFRARVCLLCVTSLELVTAIADARTLSPPPPPSAASVVSLGVDWPSFLQRHDPHWNWGSHQGACSTVCVCACVCACVLRVCVCTCVCVVCVCVYECVLTV